MTGQQDDPDARDDLDDRLRDFLASRSAGTPSRALASRILALADGVQQRPRGRIPREVWPGGRRYMDGFRGSLALLSAGVVVVIASVLVGTVATPSPRATPGASGGALASPPATSAAATDSPATFPPHVAGTCPVTPITRLAGGTAPEVDVSGLRWRWGDVPWVAGVDEKVVWLADSVDLPPISVFATQLDRPILVGDKEHAFPSAVGAVYAAAVDAGPAGSVRVPRPGCWLLAATWSAGSSSVVVAVNPPPGAPTPAPPATDPIVASSPVTTCPATPTSTADVPQGWPGPAVTDGPFRWLLPPSQTWIIGGSGDKLVLDSQVGWAIGEMRIVAIPLAQTPTVGRLAAKVVDGDIPPGFGGGTMGFGVTLPAPGCWAFVFVDPMTTSTIVADLSR